MEKAQVELFRAIRSGDMEKARKAYSKGANVNWPLDRWLMNGRQHWGLRVHAKPLGIYLGFSARESWMVPVGEGADRGDTLIMVALKCRMPEAVAFLAGCDKLNMNCLNEAGNSAMHIARATHQESLLQGGVLPPPGQGGGAGAGAAAQADYHEAVPAWQQEAAAGAQFQIHQQQQHHPQQQQQAVAAGGAGGAGYHEALPAWQQEAAAGAQFQNQQQQQGGGKGGGGKGGQDVVYASVVAETVPGGGGRAAAHGTAPPVYATAEAVGGVGFAQASAPVQPSGGNPTGGRGQSNPYDPSDGRGRANLRHGRTAGTGAARAFTGSFGAF